MFEALNPSEIALAVVIFNVSAVPAPPSKTSPEFPVKISALNVSFFSVPVIVSALVVKLPVCHTQKSPLFISFTPL